MATAPNYRSAICLATTIAIIEAVESEKKKPEVAKSFDIPKSSWSMILKNKESLRKVHGTSRIAPIRKRMCLDTHQEVE